MTQSFVKIMSHTFLDLSVASDDRRRFPVPWQQVSGSTPWSCHTLRHIFCLFFHGVGGENPRLDPRILSHKQTPVSRCQPLPFSAHARLFGGLPPYPPSHHVCLPPLPCVLASLCASSRASGEGGRWKRERERSQSESRETIWTKTSPNK